MLTPAQVGGFFDELRKIALAADPLAPAREALRQTQRVGKLGVKKPPDPNFRAMATKV